MMLNRMIVKTVNAAWPATNEMSAGADAATKQTTGNSVHSTAWFVPMIATSPPPIAKPSAVPSSARSTVAPVESAFERSTDSAPSPIQKAFWASARRAISTANASPAAARTLFCSHTECRSRCPLARRAARPPAAPGRPEQPGHHDRVSAAAIADTVCPDQPDRVAEFVRGVERTSELAGRAEPSRTASARSVSIASAATASRACSKAAMHVARSAQAASAGPSPSWASVSAQAIISAGAGLAQPPALFGPPVRGVGTGVDDDRGDPFEFVDQPHQQPGAGAQGRGARCRRHAERRTQLAGSRPHRHQRIRFAGRRRLEVQHAADGPAQRCGPLPQHVLVGRRPDEQRDRDRHHARNRPSRAAGPAGRPRPPGSSTARMNDSSAACTPALITELITPANSTANEITAIATTASQSGDAANEPIVMSTTPATASAV